MLTQDGRALARPQHPLDLPRAAVWTLAGIGESSLWLARKLDDAIQGPVAEKTAAVRVRGSMSVRSSHEQYLVPDSWRLR